MARWRSELASAVLNSSCSPLTRPSELKLTASGASEEQKARG